MTQPTILLTGCFELLNEGQLRLIAWAAQFGRVVIGIDDDEGIRQLGKGPGRPVLNEQERRGLLKQLPHVDAVFVFNGPGAASAITITKPALWVKGGEYELNTLREDERKAARECGAGIAFAPPNQCLHSSDIISRIQKAAAVTR